jgi:hypothetical protein
METADDAFTALKDFIFNKGPEFSNRSLYVNDTIITVIR